MKKQPESAVETLERVLAQKIRVKQKDLTQWQARRETAAQKEEQCLREIAEMELAVAVFRRAFGLEAGAPPTKDLNVLRYRSQTIANSAFEIMHESGGRARVVSITKILVRAGKIKASRSAYSTVTKTLDRDDRFEKVSPGTFKLAEGAEHARPRKKRRKLTPST